MNFFRTVAHIDLVALQHNLLQVKKKVPSSKILAMVKSQAYGHGAVEISRALKSRVDALAVATISEALKLHANKIHTRIIIWGGYLNREELQTITNHGFETVIHNFEQIDILEQNKLIRPIAVWLKIDTGMHRLGFQSHEVTLAKKRLQTIKHVQQPLYYMTHFSDAPLITRQKTLHQIDNFKNITAACEGSKGLANSSAILNWRQSYCEWIRPGIVLYGISPMNRVSADKLGFIPVMTLTSKIIAIKNIAKGEEVGYYSTWIAPKETRLGVVAIGYGDGYPRHIKSETKVLVNDKCCPIVGRVSMDYTTIDLTELPNVKVGDQIILWGRGLPIEYLAKQAGTSPYELCCQLTSRVKFIYYNNREVFDKTINIV